MRTNSYLIQGFCTGLLLLLALATNAQITAPGHDRDLKTIRDLQANSILDRDSVTLVDTVVLFDPDTYVETMRVIESRLSIRDYCTEILGYDTPNELLKGDILTITNPVTYEPMKIRWNPEASKIDTIQAP